MSHEFQSIGIIHSPFTTLENMPIQPAGAAGIKGEIEIFSRYQSGLSDLDGFSHINILYVFHRSEGFNLEVVPFLDTQKRGLFATRAPKRPNPIGMSVVRLLAVEANILHVENIDILEGTPLLDIKPYVPVFDEAQDIRIGWLEGAQTRAAETKSDGRFTPT